MCSRYSLLRWFTDQLILRDLHFLPIHLFINANDICCDSNHHSIELWNRFMNWQHRRCSLCFSHNGTGKSTNLLNLSFSYSQCLLSFSIDLTLDLEKRYEWLKFKLKQFLEFCYDNSVLAFPFSCTHFLSLIFFFVAAHDIHTHALHNYSKVVRGRFSGSLAVRRERGSFSGCACVSECVCCVCILLNRYIVCYFEHCLIWYITICGCILL